MGFWEEQGEDSNGVRFLTSDEFGELKSAKAVIAVAAVSAPQDDTKYAERNEDGSLKQPVPQRIIVTFIPKGSDEPVKYGFKTGEVDSRDRNLVAMRGYIAENGPVEARLAPAGRGVTFTAV
jgi:hypothetical protein